MNERIRELGDQAKPLDENGQKVRGLNSEYHDQWMEKFAELIVRECASICYKSSLLDADAHAQNLLYEFNIDNCRDQK